MFNTLLKPVQQFVRGLSGRQRYPFTEQEYREPYSGIAPAVQRLMEAIESQLPPYADEGGYDRLSPGQKALAEAIVYLGYQRLDQAKGICAEALHDPQGPGEQWVTSLIDAIQIAERMPGTDPQAWKDNRAAIDAQWKAKRDRMDAIIAQLKRK